MKGNISRRIQNLTGPHGDYAARHNDDNDDKQRKQNKQEAWIGRYAGLVAENRLQLGPQTIEDDINGADCMLLDGQRFKCVS